jgi:hypothetical protein
LILLTKFLEFCVKFRLAHERRKLPSLEPTRHPRLLRTENQGTQGGRQEPWALRARAMICVEAGKRGTKFHGSRHVHQSERLSLSSRTHAAVELSRTDTEPQYPERDEKPRGQKFSIFIVTDQEESSS